MSTSRKILITVFENFFETMESRESRVFTHLGPSPWYAVWGFGTSSAAWGRGLTRLDAIKDCVESCRRMRCYERAGQALVEDIIVDLDSGQEEVPIATKTYGPTAWALLNEDEP